MGADAQQQDFGEAQQRFEKAQGRFEEAQRRLASMIFLEIGRSVLQPQVNTT